MIDPFIAAAELRGARALLSVLRPFLAADYLCVADRWLNDQEREISKSEAQLAELATLERKIRKGAATEAEHEAYRRLDAEAPASLDVVRKERVLDPQPAPVPAEGDVWAEIIAELPEGHVLRPLAIERRQQGIDRYGVPLQRDNGRDHLMDALQEALDLMVYLRACDGPGQSTAELVAMYVAKEVQRREVKP